jgi:hypothetical protein
VVFDYNGKTIPVDATIERFNYENPYKFKIDKKMNVYQLSGPEEDAFIGKRRKIKLKNPLKKIGKQIKKFGLAPNRNAFLGLVSLNVLNLANRIYGSDRNKVKSTWEKLGGDFSKLQKAVNNGLKKGFGKGKNKAKIYGVGVGDPASGTALLAAGPVLAAFLKILISGKQAKVDENGKVITDEKGNVILESGADFAQRLGTAGINLGEETNKLKKVFDLNKNDEIENVKAETVIVDKERGGNKNLLLIGGGLLAAVVAYNALKPKTKN